MFSTLLIHFTPLQVMHHQVRFHSTLKSFPWLSSLPIFSITPYKYAFELMLATPLGFQMSSSKKVKELFWRSNTMEEADNSRVQTKVIN